MSVSHGTPGHRSKLLTFYDFVESTAVSRQPFVELRMAKTMDPTGWAAEGSGIYSQDAAFEYDGLVRPVVGVECSVSPYTLDRVDDSISGVVVGGKWFWNDDAAVPKLYLELPDSSDPANAVVVVHLLFTFATQAVVHPHLSPNRLLNGGFEDATTSINLDNWTEDVSGSGYDIAQDDALSPLGLFSARMRAIDTTSGHQQIIQAISGTVVSGAWYRVSGLYRTSVDYANLETRLYIGASAPNYISEDGRNIDANDVPVLQATQGEVRGFSFDFISPASTLDFVPSLRWVSGTANGSVWLDDLRFQRIYRFCFYDPRLDGNAIPELSMAMARLGFGGKTVGIGSVRIINQDGAFEPAFGDLVPVSATVVMGGAFPDGQTLPREDCRVWYPGVVMDLEADDAAFELRLEVQTFLQTVLPLNDYSLGEFPMMELNRVGTGRPLAFGRGNFGGDATRYTNPTLIDRDATTLYGVYELLDTSDAPAGIGSAQTIHTFLTDELRDLAQ